MHATASRKSSAPVAPRVGKRLAQGGHRVPAGGRRRPRSLDRRPAAATGRTATSNAWQCVAPEGIAADPLHLSYRGLALGPAAVDSIANAAREASEAVSAAQTLEGDATAGWIVWGVEQGVIGAGEIDAIGKDAGAALNALSARAVAHVSMTIRTRLDQLGIGHAPVEDDGQATLQFEGREQSFLFDGWRIFRFERFASLDADLIAALHETLLSPRHGIGMCLHELLDNIVGFDFDMDELRQVRETVQAQHGSDEAAVARDVWRHYRTRLSESLGDEFDPESDDSDYLFEDRSELMTVLDATLAERAACRPAPGASATATPAATRAAVEAIVSKARALSEATAGFVPAAREGRPHEIGTVFAFSSATPATDRLIDTCARSLDDGSGDLPVVGFDLEGESPILIGMQLEGSLSLLRELELILA